MPTVADGGAYHDFSKGTETMVQTATKPRDVAMILINGLDAMLQERRRSTGECG
jgi:hypothetical protein